MEPAAIITYQYQILRYRHDAVTGEFVNVGLLYFNEESSFLKAEMITKYGRISEFFQKEVAGNYLLQTLKQVKREAELLAKRLPKELNLLNFRSVADIANHVLPKDDTGLFFSDVFTGIHFDHQVAFSELYARIVEKYTPEGVHRHDDSYAWKEIYKRHFDRRKITERLTASKVKTSSDELEFDHAWENGALHCFQSLSFDLKNDLNIKNKVYSWDGKIHELATAKNPVQLYLLSVLPKEKDPQLTALIERKLNRKEGNVQVELIKEEEAERFAARLQVEMDLHDAEFEKNGQS